MKSVLNNIIVFFVIGIIALIIVPLPTYVLDFMFIFNIAVSLMILAMTMYITTPLEFSIFPSMLLITTIMRLALSISSARLILGNRGQAGQVIETFGSFVLKGNAVVGFIVFLIIIVVQFIVITKGAERIAEVSARFTLDAMPGKQMAIDADLSSGLITEDEARSRREKIQKESEFFGAMDGATKLVKGDAIAAIIIAMINLIGGTIIGMVQGGMTFSQVLNIYSIATVGEGLACQLPALMVSTATGMVVTRSASDGNLNEDVKRQFTSQPRVLVFAGVSVISMNMIPGAPRIQITIMALVLLVMGIILLRSQRRRTEESQKNELQELIEDKGSEADYYRNIDNVYNLLGVEAIEMEFGYSLLPLVDEASGGSFIDRIIIFRKQFALDMGVVVPTVRLRDNGLINPNQYLIKIKGEEIARGEVLVDYYLALDPGNVAGPIEGIDTIEPAYEIPGKWISETEREMAEIYGYTVIDALSVIVTHMSEIIKRHIHELISRQDVNTLLENVKKSNQAVVDDVIPGVITVSGLQKILMNLLREGIPIRDMEGIIETAGDYGLTIQDPDMLTEYIRQRLKRTITRKYTDGSSIKVITLDQYVENSILNSVKQSEHGAYLAMEPGIVQQIVEDATTQINKVKELIHQPIILTSPIVRVYFKKLIEQFIPNLIVLSFNEIDTNIQIQAIGLIKGNPSAQAG